MPEGSWIEQAGWQGEKAEKFEVGRKCIQFDSENNQMWLTEGLITVDRYPSRENGLKTIKVF